jgi:hypothetical protein
MHKDQVLIKKTNKIDIHGYILSEKLVPSIFKTNFLGVINTLCGVRKKIVSNILFHQILISFLKKKLKKKKKKLANTSLDRIIKLCYNNTNYSMPMGKHKNRQGK